MNAMKLIMMLLLATILISGCATNGVVTDSCTWIKPILISKRDVLTKGTADQVLSHNLSWKEFCK